MFGQIKRNSAERHRIKANRYIEEKEYNLAIEELRKVLNISPNSDRILYAIGWCYNKLNSPENAVKYCRDAINLNPAISTYHRFLGECLFDMGKSDEAISHFSCAIDVDLGKDPASYFSRGSVLCNLGRYSEAINDLTKAVHLNPNKAIYYEYRGYCLVNTNHYSEAIDDYTSAIQLNQNNASYYNNRAFCLSSINHYSEAIDDYTRAIGLDPHQAEYYDGKAFCLSSINQYPEAIDAYTQAISLDPHQAEYYSARGGCFYDISSYSRAIDDYTQAINLAPPHAEYYSARGGCFYNLNCYSEAIDDFTKALSLNPDEASYYYRRGYCYFCLGCYSEAIEDYTEAITIDPIDAKVYVLRGCCFGSLDEHSKAVDDFTKAFTLDSNIANRYPVAYSGRGFSLMCLNMYSAALDDITQILELNPNDAKYYSLRGQCLGNLGRYDDALSDYEHAIDIDPSIVDYYINVSCSLLKLHQYDKCISILTTALSLNAKNDDKLSIYLNRGSAYFMNGDYEEALIDFDLAISINPKSITGYFNKCLCLNSIEKYEESIDCCSQALVMGGDSGLYELRGKCFYQLEQYEDALADFISARNYGESVEVNGYVADCLEKLGQYDEALMLYRANLHSEPDEPEHYFKVGYIYFKQQCFETALSHLNEGLRLNDSDVDMWYYKGQCHLKIQQYEEALSATQKCIKLNLHSDPDVLYPLENTAHKIRELIQSEKKWANISHVTFMGNHNPINIGGIQATDNASIQRSVIERELNDVSDTLLKYINKNNVKMDEIEPDLDSLSYVIERSFSKPGAFHLTIVGDHNPINIGGMQATDFGVIQRSNTGKKEGN